MASAYNDQGPAIDTILLIHGLWLTPRCWEHWIGHYADSGFNVLAPAWPGMEAEVEALRKDPSVMEGLSVDDVADHYDKVVRNLSRPPVLIGHSFGGLIVQILLDRGLGAAGVALHSAPAKGVYRLPASSVRSSFPVLRNPANRKRTVALTAEQWHYAFANTLDRTDSAVAYARYHVPAPGRPLWEAATANLRRRSPTRVDFRHHRAPLLMIAGGADRTVPAAMCRENAKRYRKSSAVTDYHEFPDRPHFTTGAPGWEDVADFALRWAQSRHATV
ncbi:MAG TPA: alpha/beta hydrolase [Nocardioidaceae bacterium]|nr:alpha/beta hydrolase [Nocardioidaceae bacterium]